MKRVLSVEERMWEKVRSVCVFQGSINLRSVHLMTLNSDRFVSYQFHRSRKNPLSLSAVLQLPTFYQWKVEKLR